MFWNMKTSGRAKLNWKAKSEMFTRLHFVPVWLFASNKQKSNYNPGDANINSHLSNKLGPVYQHMVLNKQKTSTSTRPTSPSSFKIVSCNRYVIKNIPLLESPNPVTPPTLSPKNTNGDISETKRAIRDTRCFFLSLEPPRKVSSTKKLT